MKTLYGIIGFTGFFILIGGAGGAERVSFSTMVSVTLFGLTLMLSSIVLVNMRTARLKRKRHIYMKRRAETIRKNAKIANVQRNIPNGITMIVSGKIKSLELC